MRVGKFLLSALLFLLFATQPVSATVYYFNTSTFAPGELQLRRTLENGSIGQSTTSAIILGNTKVGSWKTAPLGITSIPAGTYTFDVWARKESTIGITNVYANVYLNDTSTLIGTSLPQTITTTLSKRNFTLTTLTPTSVQPTDRILVELYVGVLQISLTASNVYTYWGTNTYDSTVNLPVTGQTYLSQQASSGLGNITKLAQSQQVTGQLGQIRVVDGRETFTGWNLNAAASNFTCCSGTRTIGVANVNVNPNNATFTVSCVINQGITIGSAYQFTSTIDQTSVLSASNGNGEGSFVINPAITISLPSSTYAGSYSGTIVLTLI